MLALSATLITGCSDDDDLTMVEPTEKTFTITIENIATAGEYFGTGVFNTPVGASAPAAIGPAEAYEFRFGAGPGHRLSFATMMVQSNDLFYAPSGAGIMLFDGTNPVTGDITDQIMLWDAGSEANEEPGLGDNQPPHQSGPNTGAADSDNNVRLVDDTFSYPAVSDVLSATLTYHGHNEFTLRLENVSSSTTLMPPSGPTLAVPLAPGVFVVHTEDNPLFTADMPGFGEGLAALAEDGNPALLAPVLDGRTGIASPLAPGAFAIHSSGMPLFATGMNAMGTGLENLAEDGDPSVLFGELDGSTSIEEVGTFAIPVGAAAAGALLPGHSYEFSVTAEPGDYLSFATMFVQSNDLFLGSADHGIELFDVSGEALMGDITDQIMLWDAGTENNQWPGVGADQAPRQTGPDMGDDDGSAMVRLVNDGFSYPEINQAIRVTVTVQ